MSEADRPTNPSPSASSDAAAAQEPIDPSPPDLGDDEGWETVNLPNTITIEVLEQQGDNSQQNALALPLAGLTTPGGLATTTPEAWKSDNLVDRIAKLEIAIQEYRDRLGQDQARFDAQRQLLAQRTIELKAANEQIEVQNRHIETLEAQTAQQQSTIDSLTTKVESLSQQLAQIERECALTQQRYTQESQLRQKAEINVQELRSRLHRQQHQTLQFKAALEKCLEVPLNPDTATATASTTEANPSIFPKAPSIQPWSPPPATGTVGNVATVATVATVGNVATVATVGSNIPPLPTPPTPPTPRTPPTPPTPPASPTPPLLPVSQSPGPLVQNSQKAPSPLVYPKDANVKKRRSLAAVQLPNFAT